MEMDKTSKQELRNRYLQYRNALTKEDRRTKSNQILEMLSSWECFEQAESILVYCSYRSEVVTTPWIDTLIAEGKKKVYAPKVDGMDIRFFQVTSMEQLKDGYQGILEPVGDTGEFTTDTEKALLILPGTVFDRNGNRLGYGKGFYDRFVAKYPDMKTVALAFSCQMTEKIPAEPHDIKVQSIITEKKKYDFM